MDVYGQEMSWHVTHLAELCPLVPKQGVKP